MPLNVPDDQMLTTEQIGNLLARHAPKREQFRTQAEFESALVPFSVAVALSARVDVAERVVDVLANKLNAVIKVVGSHHKVLADLGTEEEVATAAPAVTEAASQTQGASEPVGAPNDKTPFPAGLSFRAEGPVTSGTKVAVIEPSEAVPPPDTVGRVVSVAPIPPSAPASAIVPPGAQQAPPPPANGKR